MSYSRRRLPPGWCCGSPQHLHQYAAHAAWLEDHRRLDNGALAHRAIGLALKQGKSNQWTGYWQRRAA
jgi:hypothetical protein